MLSSTNRAGLAERDDSGARDLSLGLLRSLRFLGRFRGSRRFDRLAFLASRVVLHHKCRHLLDRSGDLASLNGSAIHGKVRRGGITAFLFSFPGLNHLVAERLCLKIMHMEVDTVLTLDPESLFDRAEAEKVEFEEALADHLGLIPVKTVLAVSIFTPTAAEYEASGVDYWIIISDRNRGREGSNKYLSSADTRHTRAEGSRSARSYYP